MSKTTTKTRRTKDPAPKKKTRAEIAKENCRFRWSSQSSARHILLCQHKSHRIVVYNDERWKAIEPKLRELGMYGDSNVVENGQGEEVRASSVCQADALRGLSA